MVHDTKITVSRSRQWYWYAGFAPPVVVFILERVKLLSGHVEWTLILMLMMGTWFAWACPYLEARDPRPQLRVTWTQRRESLRGHLWVVPVFASAFGILLGAIMPIVTWFVVGRMEWGTSEWIGVCLLVASPGLLWFAELLHRAIVRLESRRPLLCHVCGYDLRVVTEEKCPECGEGIIRT